MSGPSISMYRGSGSGGIDLNFVEYFEDLADALPSLIDSVLQQIANEEEDKIRSKAKALDSWSDVSDRISVVYDGEGLAYEVEGVEQNDFMKREYGDMESHPSPLFRHASIQAEHNIPIIFEQRMRGLL